MSTELQQAAQPADVTDSMIREAFLANGFTIKEGHNDLKPYVYAAARAILALRPAAVPMTDEHLSVLKEMADRCPELNLSNYDSDDVDELNSWAVEIAVYIDGIAAQAKKEGA